MRGPVRAAAAVVAVALIATGCGAPDFGDEPSSYSSNWPQADPTPSESVGDEPAIHLPPSIGGEGQDGSEPNYAAEVELPINGSVADAAYGSGSRTLTLLVYGGSAAAIESVVAAHKKLGGSRVGRSTCTTKSTVKVCWRADEALVVSVTGSRKRSFEDLAAATDDGWTAQSES